MLRVPKIFKNFIMVSHLIDLNSKIFVTLLLFKTWDIETETTSVNQDIWVNIAEAVY